jgi:hypothetical protein
VTSPVIVPLVSNVRPIPCHRGDRRSSDDCVYLLAGTGIGRDGGPANPGCCDSCAATAAPVVTVTKQPAQGDISLRPGQETTIAASAAGTCAGRSVAGTGVYYTARPGAAGTDRFSVEARLASGETSRRNFEVTIAN